MRIHPNNSSSHALLIATMTALVAGIVLTHASSSRAREGRASRGSDLSLPKDFRLNMTHLGSWFVPEGSAAGFHDVYAARKDIEAFRRTGEWPDGAKLVKELRSSEAGAYTTGAGVHRATAHVKQYFVMVKDADGSEKGPVWGDGWGWALYKPNQPGKNLATNYRSDCLGCHLPARKTDLIYVNAYPTLQP